MNALEGQYVSRQDLVVPGLILLATVAISFVVFAGISQLGRVPDSVHVKQKRVLGVFMGRYIAWLLRPLERVLLGRVSPNTITSLSLLVCAVSAALVAIGHLGTAAWLYACGRLLDIIAGRLARLGAEQTMPGALFDSVSARWSDAIVFTGYAWLLRDTPWLLSIIVAMGASMMVSYTRARAGGLGVDVPDGLMERAERIMVITIGTFIAALFPDSAVWILGGVLTFCASASAATAFGGFVYAFRALTRLDEEHSRSSQVERGGDAVGATHTHDCR